MAIDAINGAIAYQSQVYTPPKTTTAAVSIENENAGLQDISVNVDQTTAAVAATQEYDANAQDSDNSKENAANANANAAMEKKDNSEQLKKAIAEMNKNSENAQVQFGVHEGTNRITLKIIDKDTKDVIKEFPAEKTLDMIAKAWELAGLLVDEKR